MTINYGYTHASGVTVEGTIVQDRLFDRDTIPRKVTILAGASHLRGELLGAIADGTATSAAKGGGNTGTGTVSAVTLVKGTKLGVYTVRFTAATVFTVEDPDGFVLATNGATGVAFADDLGFTITAGGTAFVAGDGFDITVAAGSGKYVLSLAAAADGSQVPDAILLHDVDATSADQEAIVAIAGRFAIQGVIFGTGHTAASVDSVLRMKDTYLENIVG